MLNERLSSKKWFLLSLLCFALGILAWLPNLIFNHPYTYWMFTFIVNPLGIIFGVIGKSKISIILNTIMTFSFFILMVLGYLIEAIFT